ncbi:basic helix-loop-helix protein A [Arachis stenosperma]|uniref:basic helix-loop-helix protein A n=1 Tax=Arachis stenosperma TaxID=217475 RepID=UPI0025AD8BE6|nr:basic helix-loop-helix protein A [Arachis stenosperma]
MAASVGGSRLQSMLQAAVQSVQWTYSLFWQLCPQQMILVWGDGYYNGAIKTRKTVQPMEVSAEEASLQRSQQLRELYDSLSAGETNPPTRRPCAALSPEDLTESEWFYLMCVSFSFPPAVGLPGKAYARRQHVWLTGANEVDSKTFTRAILAKSARIQTVVCIPLLDGVVEFGTIDKVQEDIKFIQHVKSFFIEHHHASVHPPPPPKPALSEHSTSNPASSSDCLIYTVTDPPFPPPNLTNEDNMEEDQDNEEEEEEEEDEDDEEEEPILDSEDEKRRNNNNVSGGITEPSELMQLEMSEDIRVGSPNDGSNNLDSNFHLLAVTEADNQSGQVDSYRVDPTQRWDPIQSPLDQLQVQLPVFSPIEDQILTQEDDHYSQTVSSILQNQSTRWADSPSIACYVTCSNQSAFAKWTSLVADEHLHAATADGSSQWLLKYILFTVPYLHSNKNNEENNSSPNNTNPTSSAGPSDRLRGGGKGSGTPQDELSANHVLAERRRREKLNERFIILRSLVPFVTKMDKASILGDTIEYVKQLRRKIQDLEARIRQMEAEQQRSRTPSTTIEVHHCGSSNKEQQQHTVVVGHEKRKVRIVEGTKTATKVVAAAATEASVQVSIIESDALLELECSHREGLLLDVMLVLREMKIEVIGVQSSLNNGVFVAELRAKVKDNNCGKKVSIVEVKRALNQVIPHTGD